MSCPFCTEINTGLPPDREGVTVPTRVVRQTRNFTVVADISPLVVGHVIILPRTHILSFGSVRSADLPELNELILELADTLAERVTAPVLLEHGSDADSDHGGCVAHAHLHLVPAAIDMTVPLSPWRQTKVLSLAELNEWARRDVPYLYVGDPTGAGLVSDHLTGVPKQFIRIEVGQQVGLPDPLWDWRQHILEQNLNATVDLFCSRPRVRR